MTINRKRLAAVVFVLTICGAPVSRAMGQQESATKKRPPAIIKYEGDMAIMLAQLTERYDVTIGLEIDPLQPKPQVGLYLQDPTFTDVLNAITRSAAKYQWHESEGFADVFPLEGSSPLLDTIISNFQVTDVDEMEAINQLVNLPEVQANMKAMSSKHRDSSSVSTEKKSTKLSLSLQGVTMRQALHSIVNESGGRFWIYGRTRDGFFSISVSPM